MAEESSEVAPVPTGAQSTKENGTVQDLVSKPLLPQAVLVAIVLALLVYILKRRRSAGTMMNEKNLE